MNETSTTLRLTQYSHGAGCGCKIAPDILESILSGSLSYPDQKLLVGNHSRDDAAVYDLGDGTALISTTDFFMPIVDEPFDFGRIAAANAISDVYAMGGKPVLAIAILGWPVNVLDPAVARRVVEGGRSICAEAGIALAGGHSIDSPEPIFGLAVNGIVRLENLKQNNTAKEGDLIYLTKSLGVGIFSTAEKKGLLMKTDEGKAAAQMMTLNRAGEALGKEKAVHALTDVTGFGLLGHLGEMANESGLTALVPNLESIPLLSESVIEYIRLGAVPGGTNRNWKSYGDSIHLAGNLPLPDEEIIALLADPQTSGGLLIAVDPAGKAAVEEVLRQSGLERFAKPLGRFVARQAKAIWVG